MVLFSLWGVDQGLPPASVASAGWRGEGNSNPELCTAAVFPFDKARSGWLPPGSPSVCPNATVSQPLSFAFWEPQPGCLAHLSLRFISELLAFAIVRAHGSRTVGINVWLFMLKSVLYKENTPVTLPSILKHSWWDCCSAPRYPGFQRFF